MRVVTSRRRTLIRTVCNKASHAAALALLLAGSVEASAQQSGGGSLPVPIDDTSEITRVIHPKAVAAAQALGLAGARPTAQAGSRQSLGQVNFPLRLMPNSRNSITNGISNFVDLDPTSGILDFSCGTRTYDGHQGTDFFLAPFSWSMMDNQEVEIVAAAPGTIVLEQDGNYDRECMPLNQLPTNLSANLVGILQDDGAYAYYYHMKKGTVTTLPIGTHVTAGQHLGFVGSSGYSTGPHLHFQLNIGAMGGNGSTVADPFAGQCGAATTLWRNQWEASLDPRLIALTTHNLPPVIPADNCNTTGQVPNYADNFNPGDTIYGLIALRDQRPSDVVTLQFVEPNGTIFRTASTGAPASGFYASAYWYNSITLPTTPTGAWKLRAVLNTADHGNFQLEKSFFVGTTPAPTTAFSAVLPSGRSIIDTSVATLFAAIVNGGGTTAYGCSLVPETPVAADFAFQTVTPLNTLTGTANESADIAAGGTQNFVIAFTPRLNFEALTQTANAVDLILRYKCANADGVAQINGVNDLTLSFSPTAVADIIALGATVTGDGIAHITSAGGSAAFAVATSNVGAATPLTVTPVTSTTLPLTLSICQTNPASGACLSGPTASVSRTFNAGETATWGIFIQAQGTIPFDPGNNRIDVNYVDGGGVLRGGTSVAVTAP
jgi:murein DD-endopeptidase MepM/ murein hydrolase activator NlpD